MIKLDEHQRSTLVNALHTAAIEYDEFATFELSKPLIEQFNRQAIDARQLADQIDQADEITLTSV